MDDAYFFGVVIYLVIISGISGILPSSFYTGSVFAGPSDSELRSSTSTSALGVASQIPFFLKILTFMFLSVSIDSFNPILGILITLINLGCISVGVIWVYDKARGIGS